MTRSSDLVMVERELDQPSIATKQATDETAASVLSEPPEAWADCETCGGEGAINRTIHVYENGCGFSHPDVEIIPCTDCMGTGGAIVDAASTYCDICGGDCSSANPPVFNCPLAKQESCPESAPRTETALATSDMLLAGARSIGLSAHTDNHVQRARECWDAMIAARGGAMPNRPGADTKSDGGVEGHADSAPLNLTLSASLNRDGGVSATAGIKPGPSDQLTKTTFGNMPRYRHVKRGGIYTVIGNAQVQTTDGLTDYEIVTVYRDCEGELWVRRKSEFHDGRFEVVAETDVNAPENAGPLGGASSAPDHTTMEER